MSFPNVKALACLAAALLIGCGDPIAAVGGAGDASAPDASAPDAQDVVDAAITDVRDAAVKDSGAPPFSIPDAPAKGSLRPCGTMAEPMPVGFLPDGRALVAQQIGSSQKLVRAWDPTNNSLEDIFITESASITTSRTGDRVIVSGGGSWFHIFDLARRRFITDAPVRVPIDGFSGDGQFVIDRNLVRRNAIGDDAFDFGALLPAHLRVLSTGLIALSPSGSSVAVVLYNRETNGVVVAVVYEDGRVVVLPRGSVSDLDQISCAGECGFRWSDDGRRLLMFSPFLSLRVWDVEANALLLAEEGALRFANFLPDATRLITVSVSDDAVVERDFAGASMMTWGRARSNAGAFPMFDAAGNRLLFLGTRPGDEGYGLALATREGGGAYWRGSTPAFDNSALAVTDNAVFALLSAWDRPADAFEVMIGRYAIRGGPLTHVLDPSGPDERQSEWRGQLVMSPDEQRLAAILPDSVRVVDATTLAPLATISVSAGMVAWSPDGQYLVSTPDLHYRDTMRAPFVPRAELALWDTRTGHGAATLPVPVVPVKVAFDDEGKKIVGWGYSSSDMKRDPVSFDVEIATRRAVLNPMFLPFVGATRELVATNTSIFRVSTGEVVSSLAVPPIESAEFSGDRSMLFGLNGKAEFATLRLFGVKDGHLIATMTGEVFHRSFTAFAPSRDGRRVAVHGVGLGGGPFVYCLEGPY